MTTDKIIKYVDISDLKTAMVGESKGLVFSVITTGMENSDQGFIFNVLPFEFSDDCQITNVGDPVRFIKEVELTPDQERMTNVRNESLRGRKIDKKKFLELIEGVDIIVAHNASFVHHFFAKEFGKSAFTDIPFACSMKGINFSSKGINSMSLEFVAYKYDFWYKTLDDTKAILKILSKNKNFEELIEKVFLPSCTVSLLGTSFSQKDDIKKLGYLWNPNRKVWYKNDVANPEKEESAVRDAGITAEIEIEQNSPDEKYKSEGI